MMIAFIIKGGNLQSNDDDVLAWKLKVFQMYVIGIVGHNSWKMYVWIWDENTHMTAKSKIYEKMRTQYISLPLTAAAADVDILLRPAKYLCTK